MYPLKCIYDKTTHICQCKEDNLVITPYQKTGFGLEPKIIVGRGKCAKLFVFCSALVAAHSPGLEGENYLFFSLCPVARLVFEVEDKT